MKKHLILAIALLMSSSVYAATDHYILRDGNHVQHLKITKIGDDVSVTTDVDSEPNPGEAGGQSCSAEITGEAKFTGKDDIVLKKHIEGEAKTCVIKIHLTATGATLEQSDECTYFAVGICHFKSNGKELLKIK